MSKNTSVILGDHFDQFINQQLNTGLRVLEAQETKVLNLHNMLVQAEQSGVANYSYNN
jgi:antitoxin ParD1/3/4